MRKSEKQTYELKMCQACELINDLFEDVETDEVNRMIDEDCATFEDFTLPDDYNWEDDEYCGGTPAWGTMWKFRDLADEEWARENLDDVRECGFTIWDVDNNLYLGINGYGYNFLRAHWIPLFDAMCAW